MNGWVEYNGDSGTTDLDYSTRVEVELRNGAHSTGRVDEFFWDHTDDDDDVIAYRIVE